MIATSWIKLLVPFPKTTACDPFPADFTTTLRLGKLIVGSSGFCGGTGGVINLGSKVGNVTSGAAGLVSGDFLFITLGVIPALTSNETIGSCWVVLLANP